MTLLHSLKSFSPSAKSLLPASRIGTVTMSFIFPCVFAVSKNRAPLMYPNLRYPNFNHADGQQSTISVTNSTIFSTRTSFLGLDELITAKWESLMKYNASAVLLVDACTSFSSQPFPGTKRFSTLHTRPGKMTRQMQKRLLIPSQSRQVKKI